MISAVINFTTAEVVIKGEADFHDELERFKSDIPQEDRHFDDTRKKWVVKNPGKYKHVPYIKNAFDVRELQPTLF